MFTEHSPDCLGSISLLFLTSTFLRKWFNISAPLLGKKKMEITGVTFIGYSVQFSRLVMSDSMTPWIAARQASLSITNPRSSLKLTSFESVMPSSHLIVCCPLLLLPPIPPSIRVFSNESVLCISGQSTGVSALTSVLPKNTQGWSPLEWTGWISLQPKELSRVFSNTTVQKHQFFGAQLSSQCNSHIHTWLLENP